MAAERDRARGEGELCFLVLLAEGALDQAKTHLAAGAYALTCEQLDEAISQLKDARVAAARLRFRDENEGLCVALATEAENR